jgi:integrase
MARLRFGRSLPTTVREYRRLIDRRIQPVLGELRLARLRTADLDTFYAALNRQAGLSPATVRQIHSILRRALRQAVRWNGIGANPAVNPTLPRLRRSEVQPPTAPSIRLVLQSAMESDATIGTVLLLAATTGMRRGELCGLQWRDLDLDLARLVVARAVAAVPDGTIEKATKTRAVRPLEPFSASRQGTRPDRPPDGVHLLAR